MAEQRNESTAAYTEHRDCANANPHDAHEWTWDGATMLCAGRSAAQTCANCGSPKAAGLCTNVMCQNHNGPSAAPVRLCCGQRHYGAVCPDGKVMCCLCFERFDLPDLSETVDGLPIDVCKTCYELENAHA